MTDADRGHRGPVSRKSLQRAKIQTVHIVLEIKIGSAIFNALVDLADAGRLRTVLYYFPQERK